MADEGFTELAGPRLRLRRFAPADLDTFVGYRSDPEIARYQSWDAPYPREAGQEFIRAMMSEHPDVPGEWFQFAVELRDTGQLIGDCGAQPLADDPRIVEIGFTLAAGHHGHGYATEAATALLDYLFTARGKHRVTANCDARNTASARVLERLGMRREGHLRQSSWAKGEWTDDLLYAILATEWPAARAAQPQRHG
jgi:RimJ/RimL family protein N-acetyltransferase